MVIPTAVLSPADLAAIRALMDASFASFTDDDWDHGLGGLHAVVRAETGEVIAHGSLVLRRMLVSGRSLRCGYVEAVAVAEHRRREGLGNAVMADLEDLARGYDLLALSASRHAVPFYLARDWQLWRGPTATLTPDGVRPTPEEDGAVYAFASSVDLTLPIICDWRDGDVW